VNQQQLLENMHQIEQIVHSVNQKEFSSLYEFLRERIEYPESFVTMLGETSSGKSSLINGLLGKELLFTGPQPTTGTVVEIMDGAESNSEEYYAVTKEAQMAPLTQEQFQKLNLKLPAEYERLRVLVQSFPKGLQGMRLFDTPGYGAIQEEHEEIVTNFLPNSDVILYVVSYRAGVKQNDADFLSYIYELLREDMKICLVINRVPSTVGETDGRIKEITGHVQDLLHREIPVYLVPSVMPANEDDAPLPEAHGLWEDVRDEIASPERQQALHRTFLAYQENLLYEIEGYLENQKLEYVVSDEERKLAEDALQEFMDKKPDIDERIEATFSRISQMSRKLFSHSADVMVQEIETEVQVANKWTSQQECAGFVEAHLMPILAKRETKNIKAYIEKELDDLNEEIESILNTAIKRFENRVTLNSAAFEKLVLNVGNKVAQRFTDQALAGFFRQYGGAGGAGAGVANAAKKGLKKLGDLVNHTFSRETHNALAKFLSKIGATSTKAITAAAVVFVELAFYLYEVAVWQSKLAKKVKAAITIWEDKSIEAVEKDLIELKAFNREEINEIFNEYQKAFTFEETIDQDGSLSEIEAQLEMVHELLRMLGKSGGVQS
jgi:GTP-binding protein EngB required for normal cell division